MRTVHEKRKDHACPHCAAAFSQANKLTRHVCARSARKAQQDADADDDDIDGLPVGSSALSCSDSLSHTTIRAVIKTSIRIRAR